MNTFEQCMKPAAILIGLLIALPMSALADKGGKPNPKSVATTIAACTVDDDTARVCSCKALSNVVLQCGTTYVKHDDIGLDPDTGTETEVYDEEFNCVDSEGLPIPGPITLVAVKSGSQKNAKHHPEGYVPVEDAPSGSGLFFGPQDCTLGIACPAEGDCPEAEAPPPVPE